MPVSRRQCYVHFSTLSEFAGPIHLFVVRTASRDNLQQQLTKAGVGTLIHYPIPPHLQQAYEGMNIPPDSLPLARTLASEVLSLPIGPHLAIDQVHAVINAATNE